jgi:hypothetical protein
MMPGGGTEYDGCITFSELKQGLAVPVFYLVDGPMYGTDQQGLKLVIVPDDESPGWLVWESKDD